MKITPVLFHRYGNLVSSGIRLGTDSYWNHCGWCFIDSDGREMFSEAIEFGVILITKQNMLKKYSSICEIKYLEEVETDVDYKSHLGDRYDFSIFGSQGAFYFSKKLFGTESFITKKISNKDIENAWFCFEWLGYMCKKENYWNLTGRDFSPLNRKGELIFDKKSLIL